MDLMRQVTAVMTVLALLGALLWVLRRRGCLTRRPPGRRLETVERLPLTPQHSVCLVRLAGRGILLGLSPSGCTVLESGEWSRYEPARPDAREATS
jgi:flagellar biosynthetic protein FliO